MVEQWLWILLNSARYYRTCLLSTDGDPWFRNPNVLSWERPSRKFPCGNEGVLVSRSLGRLANGGAPKGWVLKVLERGNRW